MMLQATRCDVKMWRHLVADSCSEVPQQRKHMILQTPDKISRTLGYVFAPYILVIYHSALGFSIYTFFLSLYLKLYLHSSPRTTSAVHPERRTGIA